MKILTDHIMISTLGYILKVKLTKTGQSDILNVYWNSFKYLLLKESFMMINDMKKGMLRRTKTIS